MFSVLQTNLLLTDTEPDRHLCCDSVLQWTNWVMAAECKTHRVFSLKTQLCLVALLNECRTHLVLKRTKYANYYIIVNSANCLVLFFVFIRDVYICKYMCVYIYIHLFATYYRLQNTFPCTVIVHVTNKHNLILICKM